MDRLARRQGADQVAQLLGAAGDGGGRAELGLHDLVARLAQRGRDELEVIDADRPQAQPREAEQAVDQDDRGTQARQGHRGVSSIPFDPTILRPRRAACQRPAPRETVFLLETENPRHGKFPRRRAAIGRNGARRLASITSDNIYPRRTSAMSVKKAEPGKTKIGWIGTGVMGRWMCEHAMKAGFAATVYNRSKEKARPL